MKILHLDRPMQVRFWMLMRRLGIYKGNFNFQMDVEPGVYIGSLKG
jgi:hypothetical protein